MDDDITTPIVFLDDFSCAIDDSITSVIVIFFGLDDFCNLDFINSLIFVKSLSPYIRSPMRSDKIKNLLYISLGFLGSSTVIKNHQLPLNINLII